MDKGQKHICPACSAVFYDLGRANPACPKCGRALDGASEIEFIKKKKKAEVKAAAPEVRLPDDFDDMGSDDQGEIFLDDEAPELPRDDEE